MMNVKSEFDAWFDGEFGNSTTPEEVVVRDMVRQGWAASRKLIDIKLPKEIITKDHGPVISKEKTIAVLAYNGIKVKS